jgi:hypothetical protein
MSPYLEKGYDHDKPLLHNIKDKKKLELYAMKVLRTVLKGLETDNSLRLLDISMNSP